MKLEKLGFGVVKMGTKWEARAHKEFFKKLGQQQKQYQLLPYRKNEKNMMRLDGRLRTRIRIVIWKQWITRQKRFWGLRKLGAPGWMAKQSAGFHNHYKAVAKTTGLHHISKEILAKYKNVLVTGEIRSVTNVDRLIKE